MDFKWKIFVFTSILLTQVYDITLADLEARQCQGLSEAQYHVARPKGVDEEEGLLRRKQENKQIAFKLKQLEEPKKEESRINKEQLLQKRQEYKEKSKNALLFSEMPSERTKPKGRSRKDQYISDSGGSDGDNEGGDAHKEKEKKRRSRDRRDKKRKHGGRKRKNRNADHSNSDSDKPESKKSRNGKKGSSKTEDDLTAKQKRIIVLKAVLTNESFFPERLRSSRKDGSSSDTCFKSRSRSKGLSQSGSSRKWRSRNRAEYFSSIGFISRWESAQSSSASEQDFISYRRNRSSHD